MACIDERPIYGLRVAGAPGWTGGARSIISFVEDCFFGFSVPRGSTGVVCGLNNSNAGVGYEEVQHGFMIQQGQWRIVEAGVVKTPSGTPYNTDDQFFIVRVGEQVFYCLRPAGTPSLNYTFDNRVPGVQLPGPIVYFSTRPTVGNQFLDSSFYSTQDEIYNELAGVLWYPGFDEGGELPSTSAVAIAEMGVTSLGVGRSEFETPVTAFGQAEVYFDAIGDHYGPSGANITMGFDVFGTDTPMTGFSRVQLPMTVTAEAAGNNVYITQQGSIFSLGFSATGGTSIKESDGYAELPFISLGTGSSDVETPVTAFGNPQFGFTANGSTSSATNGFVVLFEFGGPVLATYEDDILEVVKATSPTSIALANNVLDTVLITDIIQNFSTRSVLLTEQLFADDPILGDMKSNITETVSTTDALTFQLVALLTENMLVTSNYMLDYHGMVDILNEILIGTSTNAVRSVSLSEIINVLGATEVNRKLLTQLVSAMTIADSTNNVLTICVTETAELQAADSIELTSHLLTDILEQLDVYSMFRVSDEVAEGWVMNTEGQQPISEYDNFIFNSMTFYKDQMFTAGDAGIYTHGSDQDVGGDITAEIASMMLDFGTSRMKRIRSAYLGYTATNELVMKVRSVSDGVVSENWYKATQNAVSEAPEGSYMPVGQGLKSRYWQFELTNIDGGDFEIDQVELHPLILNRRV